MKVHKAAAIVPKMLDEEFAELKSRIAAVGLIQPITLHKGQILDGRHRQKACDELGIEAHYINDDELIEHGGNPYAFVLDASTRRNLTPSQRAMLAASLLPSIEEQANKRMKAGKKADPPATLPEGSGDSREKAAKQTGASARSVSKAKKVMEGGCKQLQQAVRDGRIDVSLAERVVKELDEETQQEVVAVAMVAEKPAQELKKAIPKKEAPFDSDKACNDLLESVRKRFEKLPQQYHAKAVNLLRYLMEDYV